MAGPDPLGLTCANYDALRALAASILGNGQLSLPPTGIVHEAFLRMCAAGPAPGFPGRAEFMAYAARTIRSVLVDHARRRQSAKRGAGDRGGPLDASVPRELTDQGVLELDAALDRLGALSERQRQVVELRFFGQLSVEQTAAALGVSPSTVKADWRCARAWLRQAMGA